MKRFRLYDRKNKCSFHYHNWELWVAFVIVWVSGFLLGTLFKAF